MEEIKMIDRSHAGAHQELCYAAADARVRFWTGGFPIEGKVTGLICTACGRIALYGVPKE